MTTEEMLNAALGTFKQGLKDIPEMTTYSPRESGHWDDYYHGRLNHETESIARLRLDWERNNEYALPDEKDKIFDLMFFQMQFDLLDLIVNGDVSQSRDPLLSAINGSKKRGQEPVEIEIISGTLYSEYKERKDATEYTVYVLMYVKWA